MLGELGRRETRALRSSPPTHGAALVSTVSVLLLRQLNNVAAAIAGGVPISAARIGAVLATVTEFRLGMAANSARLGLRNPLDLASISRREELAARQRASRATCDVPGAVGRISTTGRTDQKSGTTLEVRENS